MKTDYIELDRNAEYYERKMLQKYYYHYLLLSQQQIHKHSYIQTQQTRK